jgi:flavorubredoxin
MMESMNHQKDYNRPVEIADHIYWVGFQTRLSDFHCNPYLIADGDQAVLIDAGSRPDFAAVMMKILQTGISPGQIVALVYHHPDPDLCGSMSNMVDICANPGLKILSDPVNNIFLSYYLESDKRDLLKSVDEYGFGFTIGERVLRFFKTPFAHSAGSFITYDQKTKTLFTSDLFGSLSKHWDLFLRFEDDCLVCGDYNRCITRQGYCPLQDILEFHRKVIPSEKALKHAMNVVGSLDVQTIAPQHGSILTKKRDIAFLIGRLASLNGVGIDGIL